MHRPIFRVIVMEVFCGLTLAGCAIGENPASPQGVFAEAPYYSQADEDIYLARYRGLIASGATGGYDPLEPVVGAKDARPLPFAPAATLSQLALSEGRKYAAERNSSAFLVWRDGVLEEESYFGEFERDSLIVSKSLAKPITALLVGRAIMQGYIKSLDQPVADFIIEWQTDPVRGRITIRQMLGMRTGLLAQALSGGSEDMLYRAYLHPRHDEVIIRDYPVTDEPGTRYEYSNANAELVAPLIERATGQRYADYVSQALLQPLGAPGGSVWVNRPGGTAHSGCCMLLPAQNWVRMAILLLDDGVWEGRRLLPEGYVAEMRRVSEQNPHYGLGVWVAGDYLERRGYANPEMGVGEVLHSEPYLDRDLYLFDGNSNQVVYIVPSKRMIILRTGAVPPSDNSFLPNLMIHDANRAVGQQMPAQRQ
jgi:CubicO group peptidase (beta-lactamase class C family)